MKKISCILKTFTDKREIEMFFKALVYFQALYLNHDYYEQKNYIKGKRLYMPIKCKRCGNISNAWRSL